MPIRDDGLRSRLAYNRLLIEAEFKDVSGGKVQLQLDTAAKMPELFPVRHDSFPSQPWADSMAFNSGPNGTTIHSRVTIKVGSMTVPDLDVVQSRRGIAFDAVGLIPASIFHRIFISHSGGFVVLNPGERNPQPDRKFHFVAQIPAASKRCGRCFLMLGKTS